MYLLPKWHRWASFEAEQLPKRVQNASAIELARGSIDARRVALIGEAGSGKTSLGIAIARAAMDRRDRNAMFANVFELDRYRRERSDLELDARARDVPILMLDEMGAEARETTAVLDIVHKRYSDGLQTIVALAITPQAFADRYGSGFARRVFGDAQIIRCDAGTQPARATVARIKLPPPRPPAPPEQDPVPPPPDFLEMIARIGQGGIQ